MLSDFLYPHLLGLIFGQPNSLNKILHFSYSSSSSGALGISFFSNIAFLSFKLATISSSLRILGQWSSLSWLIISWYSLSSLKFLFFFFNSSLLLFNFSDLSSSLISSASFNSLRRFLSS